MLLWDCNGGLDQCRQSRESDIPPSLSLSFSPRSEQSPLSFLLFTRRTRASRRSFTCLRLRRTYLSCTQYRVSCSLSFRPSPLPSRSLALLTHTLTPGIVIPYSPYTLAHHVHHSPSPSPSLTTHFGTAAAHSLQPLSTRPLKPLRRSHGLRSIPLHPSTAAPSQS